MQNVFPLISVLAKPPQLPYGAKYFVGWGGVGGIPYTVLALTISGTLTWFVSEPDFRFPRDFVLRNIFEKLVVRYRGKNNKGVLDRPWTIWKVLKAISSTLKCQFTENHENAKIWLFGETEHRRPGVYKVAHHFCAHFCLVKTPSIAI